MIKRFAIILACAALAGCEYTTPLAREPKLPIDKALIGLWERQKTGDKTESLLVLPLNDREYLVSFPAGTPDAMFGKACLWSESGLTLVQLDWFGTAKAGLPRDKRTFQFAAYSAGGETLKFRMLSTAVVPENTASPSELAELIVRNRDDADLFREEMTFTRVKTD